MHAGGGPRRPPRVRRCPRAVGRGTKQARVRATPAALLPPCLGFTTKAVEVLEINSKLLAIECVGVAVAKEGAAEQFPCLAYGLVEAASAAAGIVAGPESFQYPSRLVGCRCTARYAISSAVACRRGCFSCSQSARDGPRRRTPSRSLRASVAATSTDAESCADRTAEVAVLSALVQRVRDVLGGGGPVARVAPSMPSSLVSPRIRARAVRTRYAGVTRWGSARRRVAKRSTFRKRTRSSKTKTTQAASSSVAPIVPDGNGAENDCGNCGSAGRSPSQCEGE